MKEYIERSAAMESILGLTIADPAGAQYADAVYYNLQRLPAADVVEVRHGRWDENGRCTLCGGHAPFWAMASTYYKSPWCHECGARMDKEDEHEAD